MPCFVGHDHFYKDIARKDFGFAFLGHALGVGLRGQLNGDSHIGDEMGNAAVFDDFFKIGLDFVFIAGIGMDDIPFRCVCIFAHLLSQPCLLRYRADEVDEVFKFGNSLVETVIDKREAGSDDDDGNQYDSRIFQKLLRRGPNELFELASVILEKLSDSFPDARLFLLGCFCHFFLLTAYDRH